MTLTPMAPATPDAADPVLTARCRNCEAALQGPYCAQCGQQALHADPTLRELAHEATHELLHLDGKLLHTLRLLFTRPGALTAEFLQGRRVRYVSPLKLYLTCSLVYFLAVAITNPVEKAVERRSPVTITNAPAGVNDAARVSDDSVAALIERAGRERGGAFGIFMTRSAHVQRDKAGFARRMREALPQIFFAFVPLFAASVALVYRRRANFPAHLYFALHVFAFCFAAAALARVVSLVPRVEEAVGVLEALAFVAYAHMALRRVYGGSWPRTIARGALVGAISFLAFTVVGLVGIALVLLTF